MSHHYQAIAEIDEVALAHNLQQVKSRVGSARILAMVKANAYGHDMQCVINGLSEADAFGVANLSEALQLRHLGITKPVVIMQGFSQASDLPAIYQHHFEIVVHHIHQVEALEKTHLMRPLRVWLKIDTGMHRLGFRPEEVSTIWTRLQQCRSVAKPIGLMTHFADADHPIKGTMMLQMQCFQEMTAGLSGERSVANSAALLHDPTLHCDWVRPGILLYGVSPLATVTGVDLNLKPVMTLRSHIIAIKQCYRGDAIGYGGEFRCAEDMLVGVIGLGYSDGYPRHATNGTPVLVNDQQVTLVGRVSMDMITVDLRSAPETRIGDPVVLWGKGLPIEHVAANAGTIPYELLCKFTHRVKVISDPRR